MTSAAINRHGIEAMIASQASFAVSDTMVKLATAELPPGEILAVRGLFAVAIMLGYIFVINGWRDLRHLRQPTALLRASLESVISLLFVLSVGLMPIANYTAILQSAPLMITAFSVLAFGTKVGWRRWTAIFLGFAGVLLVAKPDAGGFSPAALFAVACATLVAVRDIITRMIPAAVPSHAVTLATTSSTLLLGLAITFFNGFVIPEPRLLAWLALAALGVTLGNFFVILACRRADLSVVAPFRYTNMPFALLSGFLVWRNLPDLWGLLGIAMICGSGIYAFHRERMRAQAALQG